MYRWQDRPTAVLHLKHRREKRAAHARLQAVRATFSEAMRDEASLATRVARKLFRLIAWLR